MAYEVSREERTEQRAAVVRAQLPHDGIPEFMGRAFGAVLAAVGGEAGVAGPPFARYEFAPEGFTVEAGFPVPDAVPAGRDVEVTTLPGGLVAAVMHVGPYDELGGAYGFLEAWLTDNGYAPTGGPWESYLDGPEVERPRTIVSWPCQRV
jgi:effector-binding domain-containing protein